MQDQVGFRPSVGSDINFIYANWLRDLRDGDRSALPDDLWFPAHREAITRVLADATVKVVIAHDFKDPNLILGFVVAKPGKWLHWVHIRQKLRQKHTGLVPALLREVGISEGDPAVWSTPAGRALRNPPRPRLARAELALPRVDGHQA